MWKFKDDKTKPIITAQEHIKSCHRSNQLILPETALLFYMHGGIEYVNSNYNTKLLSEKFPRFLNSCPIYQINGYNNLCFLRGGWGAPLAVDTIETLSAFGVKNIIAAGMFGAFSNNVQSGDIIIPSKAFVEEGASLHYYESIDYSQPDEKLRNLALKEITDSKSYPVVSTDSVYRQTFYKENLWREKGAVGVDMETSALFSVGKYLGLNVVSILIASDKHPIDESSTKWQWRMTADIRKDFFEKCLKFALKV